MPPPSWIGYTLKGRYKIESLLGQGGMSAVYKGVDPNLRRPVAIKLIHSHLAADKDFIHRFEEEAAAVAGLRHPNIVQVFDFDHEDDYYYMILEYVTGESLQERLTTYHNAGQRMPLPEVVRVTALVCEAVHYAHERDLIHRDIKPANVMISNSGQPILMDFGVAKIMGGKQFTATGAVIGTPAYIAPELVRGKSPDRRADIYSLGVMLYEMLAGKLPFDADSAMSLMMMHLSEPPPDLRQLAPQVPQAIVSVVERALSKDPTQRFQTAAEFSQALRAAYGGKSTSPAIAQPTPSGLSTIPPTTTPPPAARARPPPPPPPPGRWRHNKPGIIGAVVATGICIVALVALATGGYLFNLFGNRTPVANLTATTEANLLSFKQTATALANEQGSTATAPLEATPTQFVPPTETATLELIPTETATLEPTATAVVLPTNTPATFFATITGIQIVDGRYSVSFQTSNYQSALPGMHIHLYFNTVSQSQAGAPGGGPWFVHGAGSPVSPYAVSERPGGATQMCILVANPDHTIILNSGNCVDLP